MVEHAEAAPSHEAVVQGFVRTVGRRGVVPAQPVADDVEDTADQPLIIHSRHGVGERKRGAIRRMCALVSQNRLAMATPPAIMESAIQINR